MQLSQITSRVNALSTFKSWFVQMSKIERRGYDVMLVKHGQYSVVLREPKWLEGQQAALN